jgi:asparagine synthase (glutamine-hydrolysing)
MIPRMPEFYDEPFADSSQLPTSLVSQLARRHVTVSLSGDGGDEVFCGYNRVVQLTRLFEISRHLPRPVRRATASLLNAVPTSAYEAVLRRRQFGVLGDQVQKIAAVAELDTLDEMYQRLTRHWEDPSLLVPGSRMPATTLTNGAWWPGDLPPLTKLMWVEAMTSLPDDMLTKVDRAGMGFGLESRVPLLDHRVIGFAWSLPERFLIRDKQRKWALRQVLYRHVPAALVDLPKSGFGIPIDRWLMGPLREWAEDMLSADALKRDGYLNVPLVRTTWEEHLSGRRKSQSKLWSVLMFQSWLAFESDTR